MLLLDIYICIERVFYRKLTENVMANNQFRCNTYNAPSRNP